jgi:hypothetical protein
VDNQRFDDLARSMAGGVSRRRVLGALIGGVVAVTRGRHAVGQEGQIAPGGSCDNGGGCCSTDADCCGSLGCKPTGDDICGSRCATRPFGVLLPGASCLSTDQCAGLVGGPIICADNGITTDGGLNCCRTEGGYCATGAECCGALACIQTAIYAGVCAASPDAINLPPGAPCVTQAQCSFEGGTTFCGSNGIDEDGPLNCCRNEGGACSDGSGCCNSLLCVGGVCGGTTGTMPSGNARTTLVDLNLRSRPSAADPVILVIPVGSQVTLTGEGTANGFVTVDYNGVRGWAFADFLA